jgi:hypothetical protein
MRLDDRRDRPRIARHLQRHPVARVQTLREQLKRLRCRRDPPGRAQPALRDDRHLAEIAMHVQRYRSHLVLLAVVDHDENRWANDIDGSALAAQPGKSQGRPPKSPGSTRPSSKTACPTCVLPESPSSQSAEPKPAAGHHRSPQRAVSCPEREQPGSRSSRLPVLVRCDSRLESTVASPNPVADGPRTRATSPSSCARDTTSVRRARSSSMTSSTVGGRSMGTAGPGRNIRAARVDAVETV